MSVQAHQIKFYRRALNPLCKAVCSCGWVVFGDLAKVQERAATHDLEWEAIEANTEPAVQP